MLARALNEATAATTPGMPTLQPASPALTALQNIWTNQTPSGSPLDYVSPQAAIAAGLNPQTVYSTWSSGLARYPTQSAALAAGIPAGVITQLWAASRSAAPAPSTTGTFLGVPTTYLLAGGAALFALTMFSSGKGRR